jgi:magnesium chelatase subunit I
VIGRELIRSAVSQVFDGHFPNAEVRQVVEWFDLGGSLNLGDLESAADVLSEAKKVQGLLELARLAGVPAGAPAPLMAAAVDFVLEGLYAQKKISRSDGRGFHGVDTPRRPAQSDRRAPVLTPDDDDNDMGGGENGGRKKKRYYN